MNRRETLLEKPIEIKRGDFVKVIFLQPDPHVVGKLILVRWLFRAFAVGINSEDLPDDDRLTVWPSALDGAHIDWPIMVNPDGSAVSQGVPIQVVTIIAGS